MTDRCVIQWLKRLRYSFESYEEFNNSNNINDYYYYQDDEMSDEFYEKLCHCNDRSGGEVELRLKYGEICRSSVLFDEKVEKLRILPVIFDWADFDLSDDVAMWKRQLRHTYCGEEEDVFFESEALIDECNESKPSTVSNKPSNFPVSEDDIINGEEGVEVRQHKPSRVVNRPKTFTTTQKKKEDNFDARGPFKLEIGKDICFKLKSNQHLKLSDGALCKYNYDQKVATIRENVNLQRGIKQITKKDIQMLDSNSIPYIFHFDSTKDAKNFIEMERNRTPLYLNEKMSIKSRLLKLLGKRSSRDLLEKKGIIRNEEIFGNTLRDLEEISKKPIPEFVTRIVGLIESYDNITSDGLYRISANLATVQKIRCEIDNGNLDILEHYQKDVDVLCGTLKLFFRELREPLITYDVYLELKKVMQSGDRNRIKTIIDTLPRANKETLMFLIRHLLKVCEHKDKNKMDVHNMSISWGPSLITVPDGCSSDLVAETSLFYKVTEYLLDHFQEEFYPNHKKSNDHDYYIIQKLINAADECFFKIERIYNNKYEASNTKIDAIIQNIDNLDTIQYDIHDIYSALKKIIRKLEPPLIPDSIFTQYCYDCDNLSRDEAKEKLRESLDKNQHKNTLNLLLGHFRKILTLNKTNLNSLIDYWRGVLIFGSDTAKFAIFFETLLNLNRILPDLIENRIRESRYDNVDDIDEAEFLDDDYKTDYRTKL